MRFQNSKLLFISINDVRPVRPTEKECEQAVAIGAIEDRSYRTPRDGAVQSFAGEAIVLLDNGEYGYLLGRRAFGDGTNVYTHGSILLIHLSVEAYRTIIRHIKRNTLCGI